MSTPITQDQLKKLEIFKLLPHARNLLVLKFFDVDSMERLDEKIEMLTALKEGKTISEIPNFWDLLELIPRDGQMWD